MFWVRLCGVSCKDYDTNAKSVLFTDENIVILEDNFYAKSLLITIFSSKYANFKKTKCKHNRNYQKTIQIILWKLWPESIKVFVFSSLESVKVVKVWKVHTIKIQLHLLRPMKMWTFPW